MGLEREYLIVHSPVTLVPILLSCPLPLGIAERVAGAILSVTGW